jgi:hypothetical protein
MVEQFNRGFDGLAANAPQLVQKSIDAETLRPCSKEPFPPCECCSGRRNRNKTETYP